MVHNVTNATASAATAAPAPALAFVLQLPAVHMGSANSTNGTNSTNRGGVTTAGDMVCCIQAGQELYMSLWHTANRQQQQQQQLPREQWKPLVFIKPTREEIAMKKAETFIYAVAFAWIQYLKTQAL
jgi:hypothetical protein